MTPIAAWRSALASGVGWATCLLLTLALAACGGGSGGGGGGGVDASAPSASPIAPAVPAPSTPPPATGGVPAGYALVWSDEFDTDGLPDASKWVHDTARNRLGWYKIGRASCRERVSVLV